MSKEFFGGGGVAGLGGEEAEHVEGAGVVGVGRKDGAVGEFGFAEAAGFVIADGGGEGGGEVGSGHGAKVSRGVGESYPRAFLLYCLTFLPSPHVSRLDPLPTRWQPIRSLLLGRQRKYSPLPSGGVPGEGKKEDASRTVI